MSTFTHRFLDTPVGRLRLVARSGALTGVHFPNHHGAPDDLGTLAAQDAILDQAARELDEYFGGRRTEFSVPLAATGTPFEQRVWAGLRAIPFGETRSYGDLARAIGNPRAVRAVGGANGKNPISIIVPCHRVIGADGTLTGFGGGLETKRRLLDLERPAESSLTATRRSP